VYNIANEHTQGLALRGRSIKNLQSRKSGVEVRDDTGCSACRKKVKFTPISLDRSCKWRIIIRQRARGDLARKSRSLKI
jgi:hypothetical protein